MSLVHPDIESQVATAVAPEANGTCTRVIIAAPSAALGQQLSDEMGRDPSVSGKVMSGTLAEVLGTADLDLSNVDIIAFEVSADPQADLQALERIENELLKPQFIAVCTRNLPDDIKQAFIVGGVQDLLIMKSSAPRPPQPEAKEVIEDISEAPIPADAQAAPVLNEKEPTPPVARDAQLGGDVTVLLRARGGAGASTIAVNLAASLAKDTKPGKTALIDLDLQNGAIALMLDLPDSVQATQFVKGQVLPDAAFLDSAMVRHASGMDVLTAPDVFAPLSAISVEDMGILMAALKARYDHIIIDMPQTMVEWMDPILASASRVLVVSDMSLPSVKRTRRLIDLLAEEHMTLPIKVIMNFEKKPLMVSEAQKEAAHLIGRPLLFWIPTDARAARRAIDLGTPLISNAKRSAPARALAGLAKVLFANTLKG